MPPKKKTPAKKAPAKKKTDGNKEFGWSDDEAEYVPIERHTRIQSR